MLRRGGSTASVFLAVGALSAACALALSTACSSVESETGDRPGAAQTTGTGATTTAGGSTAGTGTGGPSATTGGSGIIDIQVDASRPPANVGADAACAATSLTAERVTTTEQVKHDVVTAKPVALYLMLDRSGSMLQSTGIPFFSPSKWQQAVDAIKAFAADPSANGIDVALGFFPIDGGLCTGENYDRPVVPIGRLPSPLQIQAIDAALVSRAPGLGNNSGGTPIEGGLRGAVNFCLVFQASHPDEKCAVVLITDGAPTECATDAATLRDVAVEAFGKAQVKTFTIGMNGADPALLNTIAVGGQTDCAPATADNYCNVSTSATAFSEALKRIRETIVETVTETVTQTVSKPLDCEFKIPPAPSGQTFALDEVNVRFSHDGKTDTILKVPSETDCGAQTDRGWFYDDPKTPTKIKVCSATCGDIQAATGDGGSASASAPRVDILLGCKTETAIN